MQVNTDEDLLANLEPPVDTQYWLSEEELKAITCVSLHYAHAASPPASGVVHVSHSADPDLGAAFGNPYIPPTILNSSNFGLIAENGSGSRTRALALPDADSAESPLQSPPAGSPLDPQSPTSASSASGSGEDDGSEGSAGVPAAADAKRRRTVEEKALDLEFLGISAKQLLVISSKQLDETVARVVASGRKFTPDQRKVVTAARRRIKNREYARDMRVSQSRQMTELAGRVTELEAANHALKAQVAALQHENGMLKAQLGVGGAVYQPPTAAPRSVLGKRSTPQVAAGACLLVLLLSFGFYFNLTTPTPFDATLQGRAGVSTGRVLLHQAEPSAWSFVAAIQRAVFAYRYGGGPGTCNCEDQMRGMVCVDKEDFRDLGRRCDLSGITKHEE